MSLYRELDGDVDSLPNLIDEEELLFGGEMLCELEVRCCVRLSLIWHLFGVTYCAATHQVFSLICSHDGTNFLLH